MSDAALPIRQGATGAIPLRSMLAALSRQVEHNLPMAEAELRANIRFAVSVRDDTEEEQITLPSGEKGVRGRVTHRDRLRAVEFLESVRRAGIDVAVYLDKAEREVAGAGKAGVEVNIGGVERMTFNIPAPKIMGRETP